MQHHTQSVICPVCGNQAALLAFATQDGTTAIDPNDVGLTCTTGCRPTVEQIAPILDLDERR